MLNQKRSLPALLVAALFVSPHVGAALTIDEDFDYPAGDLATQSGGAWTQSSVTAGEEWTVSAGSLGYEKNGNTLVTSGGKAEATLVDNGKTIATFEAAGGSFIDSGTVWLSFLTARNTTSNSVEGQVRLDGNVIFGTTVSDNFYRTNVNGVSPEATTVVPSDDPAAADLLVLELIFADVDGDADNNDGIINFYINPDPGAAAPEASTLVRSVTGRNKFQMRFKSILLERENFNEKVVYFDELRLGDTYAEVTPIPEPGAMALMGLGGLLMFGRRHDA